MTGSLRWAVRWGLLAISGGMLAYIYIAAGLPGGGSLLDSSGKTILIWFTLLGAFGGWLVGVFWRRQWDKVNQQQGKKAG
jgi:hypothetical protein